MCRLHRDLALQLREEGARESRHVVQVIDGVESMQALPEIQDALGLSDGKSETSQVLEARVREADGSRRGRLVSRRGGTCRGSRAVLRPLRGCRARLGAFDPRSYRLPCF